ncbi:MAG: DNA mismatch repair protein MutS, partial [Flavobacteriia bacterium]|nr:DNA mismatch repair protein MutS [Flavobacteriia bacterium]
MKQYHQIKAKYPDALLLFRVGDFYETFGADAIKTSKILGIVLTKRKNGAAAHIELAGFPHHSLETYLPKLVRAGQRVAVCDQLEDPKMTKT